MSAPLRKPGRILATLALLSVTACGATEASEGPTYAGSERPVTQGLPASNSGSIAFGAEYRFESGLTLMISTPKSFRPSSTAYPSSERAVAVEVSIFNGGSQSFRLSNLTAVAKVDGAPAKQVVDPTQGFSGVVDAATDLQPGRNVRLMLAFAMPAKSAELTVSVQPDDTGPAMANYHGVV